MIKTIFNRPELLIVGLMVMIVAMLIIPMPPALIDGLIGFNILIAMMIFIGSFYLKTILDFSSFPSILLITTVFRLALSITTSRMILLEADAGQIVASFGTFVIGGDLLVGMVIFLIVTIVQFIVITKGSERIAEVCARFALDGLPGKQMSIDADVRAGSLDAHGARKCRSILESETQLYGALDGAMKFIKGDAIAGIIIILVNFCGGLLVANVRGGMSFAEALETYTMLTIGDGLVSQIPALLISIGAGFVVTRVNAEEDNLGKNILNQVAGKNPVLVIVAVLGILLSLLPGFPTLIFAFLTAMLMAVVVARMGGPRGAWKFLRDARCAAGGAGSSSDGAAKEASDATGGSVPETVPLSVCVATGHIATLRERKLGESIKRAIFLRLGMQIPAPVFVEGLQVPADEAWLMVNEVVAERVPFDLKRWRVLARTDEAASLDTAAKETKLADGSTSLWISDPSAITLRELGFRLRQGEDDLTWRMVQLAGRNVVEIFGIQETKNLIDALENKYPELLKETLRNAPVQRIAQILQRLLMEQVSVRNLKVVLEAVAQWAPKERDNILLSEHVRGALARYISDQAAVDGTIHGIVISPELEDFLRQHVKQTASGAYLEMPPDGTEAVMARVDDACAMAFRPVDELVLLTSVDVRRFVKRVVETKFPDLRVMSFAELADQGQLSIVTTI